MFTERRLRADRPPQNDAGLSHGRRDGPRIVGLLGDALMEEIAVGTPRFQGRFHRCAAIAWS